MKTVSDIVTKRVTDNEFIGYQLDKISDALSGIEATGMVPFDYLDYCQEIRDTLLMLINKSMSAHHSKNGKNICSLYN